MATNQTMMTGPNSQPMVPDPYRWSTNRPIRIPTDSGTTRCESPGCATSKPWSEPRTEIAGVMIPSPKNSAAPKMPSITSAPAWATRLRCSSARSAMMPPSPRLWARMMKPAYLIETTIVSAQKISDTMP